MSLDFSITKGRDVFDADNTLSARLFRERSILSESLAADTLTFEAIADPSGDAAGSSYGDEYVLRMGGQIEGRFYYISKKQLLSDRFEFYLMSAMELLASSFHKGGIYRGITAGDLIADLLSASQISQSGGSRTYSGIISYTIDNDVAAVPLYGYLRYQNVRSSLWQVLFATGAGVFKDSDGNIYIKYPVVDVYQDINDDNVYIGGSVEPVETRTRIMLAEHMYYALQTDREEILFDNTDGSGVAERKEIVFDEPMHDLSTSGSLTIESSGVNYAVVTGTGTLTGLVYTHTKRILDYSTGVQGEENVLMIEDATLVSVANSGNVAKRVAGYTAMSTEVTRDIVLGSERPGDLVRITSPFGESVQGIIKSQDIVISGIDKATTVINVGYVPGDFGNNYENYILRTSSGTITVPEGVTKMLFAISGGGHGGHGGYKAEDFWYSVFDGSHGELIGPGAESGPGGEAGKLLVVELEVVPGSTISVSIGPGGPGGAIGQDGSEGQPSSITVGGITYTSADGAVPEFGYVNIITGDVYSTKGEDGTPGQSGGEQGSGKYGGSVTVDGQVYQGGEGCDYWEGSDGRYVVRTRAAGGGGAAYKTPGSNAVAGHNAGAGATPPDADDSSVPGGGGPGGHGGGGHGYAIQTYHGSDPESGWEWRVVAGGNGSGGGDGGDGYVLAMY